MLRGQSTKHRERAFITHSGDGKMNRFPLRALRERDWKYIRNLDSGGKYHSHVDKGREGTDGREYWDSWALKAKTDPAAAAVVKRYFHRPAEELYDLKADPWEQKNLATDPHQQDRLKRMRVEVLKWMLEQGDQGLATEQRIWQERTKKVK